MGFIRDNRALGIATEVVAAFATCALLVIVSMDNARAADWPSDIPVLRGSYSVPTARWDGPYIGAQGGYTSGNADFGNANGSQISYILAQSELEPIVAGWTTLPKSGSNTQSYGGFIGYNIQWGEVVTGVELNYNHMGFNTEAQDSIGPLIVPGAAQSDGSAVQYAVSVASSASVAISDIATARATAGWAFDSLLPYGFVGLAVGRAEVTRTASVTGTKTVTPVNPVTGSLDPALATTGILNLPRNPQSDSKSLFAYGFTAGLGINVAVLPNVFLRAEWEYIQFPNVDDMRVAINSARVGLGVKF
jgi:opacity protein-like surface antigen